MIFAVRIPCGARPCAVGGPSARVAHVSRGHGLTLSKNTKSKKLVIDDTHDRDRFKHRTTPTWTRCISHTGLRRHDTNVVVVLLLK